jgi:outer membrane protein OmpA-like peptidoglycan-associated protein
MATGEQTGRGYVVSLSGVAFDSGKSNLTTEAKYVLAKLSGMLLAFPEMELAVEGFTDSTGAEDFNLELSLARAQSVTGFLTEMGVAPTKMTAEGFGPARPVSPNDTPEGRARNRRVEIVLADTD